MDFTEIWNSSRVPGEVELAAYHAGEVEPSGRAVVCLHGVSAQSHSFNALAAALAEDPESPALISLDLRGRGDSDKPDSGYGLHTHVEDVMRTLDYFGLEGATLCGHSMGAFVGLAAALTHPERVESLVLVDGGWPRPQTEPPEEEKRAIEEGLARAFSRLDMTFDSPSGYLDFWFPGQGLSPEDLPPDLADYYLYDLEETEGGYTPKTSRKAAEADSASVAAESPTAREMSGVSCPVALVRAEQGFFPGSDPLISEESRREMLSALEVREEVFLEGANHYTATWSPFVERWSGLLRGDWTR